MFDTFLRQLKDRLNEPLARRLSNISPSAVTLAALLFGLGSAVYATRGLFGWALVFWLISRILDGLDGTMARMHNKQDDFGGYLDILLDFVSYAAIPIGIVLAAPTPQRYIALAIMLAAFYINTASWMYLAAILEKRAAHTSETKTAIIMPAGLVGGFESITAYCLFLIFPAYITVLYSIFTAMIVITIFQRLLWAWRKIR